MKLRAVWVRILMSVLASAALQVVACAETCLEDKWAAGGPPESAWADAPVDYPPLIDVTITAVGDITIGGDPRKDSERGSLAHYEELLEDAGGAILANAKPYFDRENEVTVVNFESTFTASEENAKAAKSHTFRADPQHASILSDAGVDVVTHANNHAVDFAHGQADTREAVDALGMTYVGNGAVSIVLCNGVRVGVCAYSASGMYSEDNIRKMIQQARAQCDLLVASFHWGDQYKYWPDADQRELGRMAIENGADLVLGHATHVVSGVEKYRGRYIFYGLGTFSSAIRTPEDMDTLLASITFGLSPDDMGIERTLVTLVPYSMSSVSGANDARPTKLEGEARKRVLKKVKKYGGRYPTLPKKCFQ